MMNSQIPYTIPKELNAKVVICLKLKEGTKSFKAVLGDKNGDVVDINVWEADRILSDTRILPNSYTDVTYMFETIGNATSPFRIQAKLNY